MKLFKQNIIYEGKFRIKNLFNLPIHKIKTENNIFLENQYMTSWLFWLEILARNQIGFSNWKFQLGFPTNWIIQLEIPAENFSCKSQLEIQLDFPAGNSDWVFHLENPTEIQMEYPTLNSISICSWKSQLETSVEDFSLRKKVGISNWKFELKFLNRK